MNDRIIYTKIEDGERIYAVRGKISCSCQHCDTYQICCDGDQYITTNNKELIYIITGYAGLSKLCRLSFEYNNKRYEQVDEDKLEKILPFFDPKKHWISTEYVLDDGWN